ncbi:hypothetical protein [Tenacibaculum amylolyticum]|uniref:hypothetical protein n=1 Tax=Tenacibaculum amylolyticum TaxID=104269 RepID=UPI003893116C
MSKTKLNGVEYLSTPISKILPLELIDGRYHLKDDFLQDNEMLYGELTVLDFFQEAVIQSTLNFYHYVDDEYQVFNVHLKKSESSHTFLFKHIYNIHPNSNCRIYFNGLVLKSTEPIPPFVPQQPTGPILVGGPLGGF